MGQGSTQNEESEPQQGEGSILVGEMGEWLRSGRPIKEEKAFKITGDRFLTVTERNYTYIE